MKPSSVLLAADGPRVIDFGIARAADATSLTRTGTIVGSAGFMAPEQITGEDVGPEADMFALGAVLAYASTGQGPFGEGRTEALTYRVVHAEPVLDSLPDWLREIAARCLDKDPRRRSGPSEIIAALAAGPAVNYENGAAWVPEPVERLINLHQAVETAAATAWHESRPEETRRARARPLPPGPHGGPPGPAARYPASGPAYSPGRAEQASRAGGYREPW